jgi:hypothetical protein
MNVVRRILLVLVFATGTATSPSVADEFEAGFAFADITPPTGWRRAGSYTEVISTGTHDPLFAKAMVLVQGEVKLAFVGNDLCSVPRDLTDEARKRASNMTGIPVANIVITATHTHGGPEYCGPLRNSLHARAIEATTANDPHEPIDYRSRLVETWVDIISHAQEARKAVTLSVAVPQQPSLAFNRRYLMKDGSTGWNPGRLNSQILRPLGPTDIDLPFLLARDAEGTPMGGLTVFAMHTAIYGGSKFGACYPAHLQEGLREHLRAPKFISIFGEGCAGDVNHIDVSRAESSRREDYPQFVGAALAKTIHESLPYVREIAMGQLAMKSVTIQAPVLPLSERDFAEAQRLMATLDQNGAPFLTIVDAWRKMFQHQYWEQHGGKLPQEVQAIRLDRDTAIVALPHEIFVELGMAIKAASPFRRTIVISLANDIDFYIPTRRAFEEGHYEPTTCPLVPGCGERLVEAAINLLNDLKP